MVKTQIDIRRAIAESGVSIAEVAERSGIDRSNISKLWLKVGDREPNPTLSKLVAVADAIGKDVTELFYPVEADADTQTPQSPSCPQEGIVEDAAEHTLDISGKQTMQTMAYCPHCGAKVRVGVVLVS